MLNIIELEQRWLRYKIKSFIPHFIILVSLSIITVILLNVLSKSSIDNEENIQKPINTLSNHSVIEFKEEPIQEIVPIEKIVIKETIIGTPTEVVSIQRSSEKVKLSPSLDFMKKMQNSVHPYYNNEEADGNYEVDTPQSPQVKTTSKTRVLQTKSVKLSPKESEKRIDIKRKNTQSDIYEIIKRFKKNNNPALSLFVAKKYYELGNYRQSYNYALMTNKINNDIESSWIVFSKSLVKLGKKEKAIKTLKKYIKYSESNTAQILLDEIQSGKFQ